MKYQNVYEAYWKSNTVKRLDLVSSHLYIYFLTCSSCHYSGIYYIPIPTISFEMAGKMNEKQIKKGIEALINEKCIIYDWDSSNVWVLKNAYFQINSPSQAKGVINYLKNNYFPENLVAKFIECYLPLYETKFANILSELQSLSIEYQYPIDTLSIPYRHTIDTRPSTNSNSNSNSNSITNVPKTEVSGSVKNKYSSEFEKLWECYERKGEKEPSFKQWKKLNNKEQVLAYEMIDLYFKENPDKKYRKNCQKYLRDKAFQDVKERSENPIEEENKPFDKEAWLKKHGTRELRRRG